MTTFFSRDADLHFPDSDGKPMADNTEQFRWIVLIKENLEILFADQPNVFVTGDLLWYPVKSRLISPVAPDTMVVFGRPKGRRGSYKQWQEENIAPQVVYEILSPSNNASEMERKLEFYETYGVEEYYQYDPDRYELKGWRRQGEQLLPIAQMDGWTSPRLGIRFAVGNHELVIYRPDGRQFLSPVELDQRAEQERQRAEQAEQQLQDMQALLEQYRERFGELDS
ncbi:MAG: Uma2 family endonuclease [Cyanomargarita calcarea GSE-NOS-MK-12-04C]|jgi:Uma2 family endonuclease|uniref:Uma2 family endonuclease n=1 Tax=Cyanomargarita calcarea GSE-NOS-MK-12-04C TaxID=2839659 RepID=A0A951UU96_9CYAN|nr:Uma2 family endonuclease [Cyanomargarita calcarea GSE-NOS-MK-12-04C]